MAMNLKYLTQVRPTTGGDMMFRVKQFLVSAGWIVKASGDGGTNFSTGGTDFWTSGTVAQTAQAWIVLQAPTGAFEWLFQCQGATHRVYRAKISPAAGFKSTPLNASGVPTGSISATACPSATDQLIMSPAAVDDTANNGGNAPTCFDADATYILSGFVDQNAPYGHFIYASKNSQPKGSWAMFFDPLVATLLGDPDPWMAYFSASTVPMGVQAAQALVTEDGGLFTNTPMGWINRGGNPSFGGRIPVIPAWSNVNPQFSPIQGGFSPPNLGPETSVPLEYGRRVTLAGGGGYKGLSTLFKYRMTSTRSALETPAILSARDSVTVDDVVSFWDSSLPQF